MSSPAHEPVVSGRAYAVAEVDGSDPTSLDDFVAASAPETVVTLADGDRSYVVRGQGVRDGDSVVFHEKSGATGKDLRVWRIGQGGSGGFEAAHEARF